MTSDWENVDRRMLRARADEMAKPATEQQDESRSTPPLLEFVLMGLRYAVYLEKVEAVMRIGDIIPIPLTPPHISGIIRRRGESIALVSLKHFFHPDTHGVADADFAVIVSAGGKRFALQVEDIEGVIRLIEEAPRPPPENFDAAQTAHISGITTDGLAVIDLSSLVEAPGFGTTGAAG
ncbi:MAG: chemotaxis protein CheW [Deltaproteobacteria bacterium]|nr:chemotaxis protein CheW [Deltaproteobacteria bacterium]